VETSDDTVTRLPKRRAEWEKDNKATNRKTAALRMHIDASLAKLADKVEAENKVLTDGYDVNQDMLDFQLPYVSSFKQTFKVIGEMLTVSMIFSVAAVLSVYIVKWIVAGLEISDSADQQWGVGNHTEVDYEQDNFDDIYFIERDQRVKLLLTIQAGISIAICQGIMSFYLGRPFLKVLGILSIFYSLIPFFPIISYLSGVERLGGILIAVVSCLLNGAGTSIFTFLMITLYRQSTITVAAIAARKRFAAKDAESEKNTTMRQTIRLSFGVALPASFTFGAIVLYAVAVFHLCNISDSSLAKGVVSVLGLLVKVTGNKALLLILNDSVLNSWMQDLILFQYEYSTALLCRILQLSIPNPFAAMLMSLFGADLEMGVRVFFFTDFLKMGLAMKERKSKYNKEKQGLQADRDGFYKRGRMRVQDGSNDMIVE